MSSSRTAKCCCLPSVKHLYFHFFSRLMYDKTIIIIRFGFCDIQNNQGLGNVYQPQPSASANNLFLDLDYSGWRKPHPIIVYHCFLIVSTMFYHTRVAAERIEDQKQVSNRAKYKDYLFYVLFVCSYVTVNVPTVLIFHQNLQLLQVRSNIHPPQRGKVSKTK